MTRLTLVASKNGPLPVERMDTFSFARVGGELVILHNDEKSSGPEALVDILRILAPTLVMGAPPCAALARRRRVLPGDAGGFDIAELPPDHEGPG